MIVLVNTFSIYTYTYVDNEMDYNTYILMESVSSYESWITPWSIVLSLFNRTDEI